MMRLSKRTFVILSAAKAFSAARRKAIFDRSINRYLQQHTSTVEEPDHPHSTKPHTFKMLRESNFILSVAGMWGLCHAMPTEELLFCTVRNRKNGPLRVKLPLLPVTG